MSGVVVLVFLSCIRCVVRIRIYFPVIIVLKVCEIVLTNQYIWLIFSFCARISSWGVDATLTASLQPSVPITISTRMWVGSRVPTPITLSTATFHELNVCVQEMFIDSSWKIYYLPPNSGLDFHQRIRIDSDEKLMRYLDITRPRPPLLLYRSDTTLAASPNENPRDEEESVRSAASSSSRGSAQDQFAQAVRLSCNNTCVACGCRESRTLEAAHLVPVSGAFASKLSETGLVTCYDPRNGILLCAECHLHFDSGHWCVKDGSFWVSNALQHHDEKWAARHQKSFPCDAAGVNTSSRNWPYEDIWKVRIQYFEQKAEQRREEAAKKQYTCDFCGKRYANDGFYLRDHQEKCPGLKKHLFTPERLRALGDVPEEAEDEPAIGEDLCKKFADAFNTK